MTGPDERRVSVSLAEGTTEKAQHMRTERPVGSRRGVEYAAVSEEREFRNWHLRARFLGCPRAICSKRFEPCKWINWGRCISPDVSEEYEASNEKDHKH